MKKKSIKNKRNALTLFAAVCGLVAVIMCFLPFVLFKGAASNGTITGFNAMFGQSVYTMNGDTKIAEMTMTGPAVLVMVGAILALAGAVVAVLNYLMNFKGLKKILYLAVGAAFVVAAVFFFMAVKSTTDAMDGTVYAVLTNAVTKGKFELGAGAIVGGIVLALGGLASTAELLVK